MRTLAAAAGLSPMTVSLALRNHPSIPPATRDRVQAVAAEAHVRHPVDALRAASASPDPGGHCGLQLRRGGVAGRPRTS